MGQVGVERDPVVPPEQGHGVVGVDAAEDVQEGRVVGFWVGGENGQTDVEEVGLG